MDLPFSETGSRSQLLIDLMAARDPKFNGNSAIIITIT
jgi:hypothetical protein